ncbi:hypothetical protein INT47_010656 [Mucor saturninus]|uniref:Uncharacterized protein n=1 Tax=Mucor saturninus TaxID=64648 RepID=A0A8H7QMB5_9FUNG|nr:hypothetical protein INT47_010656 [Mucor saturninus]
MKLIIALLSVPCLFSLYIYHKSAAVPAPAPLPPPPSIVARTVAVIFTPDLDHLVGLESLKHEVVICIMTTDNDCEQDFLIQKLVDEKKEGYHRQTIIKNGALTAKEVEDIIESSSPPGETQVEKQEIKMDIHYIKIV